MKRSPPLTGTDYPHLLVALRAPRRRFVTTDPWWPTHGVSDPGTCPFDLHRFPPDAGWRDAGYLECVEWWLNHPWQARYVVLVACELALPAWGEWAGPLTEYEVFADGAVDVPAQLVARMRDQLIAGPGQVHASDQELQVLHRYPVPDADRPGYDLVADRYAAASACCQAVDMALRTFEAVDGGNPYDSDDLWPRDVFHEVIHRAAIAWGRDERWNPDARPLASRFCDHLWTVVRHRLAFRDVDRADAGNVVPG